MLKNIKNRYYSYLLDNFCIDPESAVKKIDAILSKMQKNNHFYEFAKKYKYPSHFENGLGLLDFIVVNNLITKDNFQKIKQIFNADDFKKSSKTLHSAYYTLAIVSPEFFVKIVNYLETDINSFLLDNNNFMENCTNSELKISYLIEKNYNKREFMNMIILNTKPTDMINWDLILPKLLYHANEPAFTKFIVKGFYEQRSIVKILNSALLMDEPSNTFKSTSKKEEIKQGFLKLKEKYEPNLYSRFEFNDSIFTHENILLLNDLDIIHIISKNNYINIIKKIFESEYINNNYFASNIEKNIQIIKILKNKISKDEEPCFKDYFIKIAFNLYFSHSENNTLKIEWMKKYFNFDFNDSDSEGNNFLHKGMSKYSEFFDKEYIDLLIKDNINLYAKNNIGLRFYDYASEDKRNELISILKEKEIKREKEKINPLISLNIVEKIKKRKRL